MTEVALPSVLVANVGRALDATLAVAVVGPERARVLAAACESQAVAPSWRADGSTSARKLWVFSPRVVGCVPVV